MSVDAVGSGDPYRGALERYRQTARWVLTGLGAAAVAAIAGFGLADYGKLDWDADRGRFIVASLGVALAIAGFLACIRQALILASESWTEPSDLPMPGDPVRDMLDDPANGLLGGYDSFESLSGAHVEALERWRENADLLTRWDDASARQLAERWRARAVVLSQTVQAAMLVASARRLRERFDRSARGLIVFGAIAAAGIVMFAWAVTNSTPGSEKSSAVPRVVLTTNDRPLNSGLIHPIDRWH